MNKIDIGLVVLILVLQDWFCKIKTRTAFSLSRPRPTLNAQKQENYQDRLFQPHPVAESTFQQQD